MWLVFSLCLFLHAVVGHANSNNTQNIAMAESENDDDDDDDGDAEAFISPQNSQKEPESSASIEQSSSDSINLSFGAKFDGYYMYNFNRPKNYTLPNNQSFAESGNPPGNTLYRSYDIYHNQFTLALLELSLKAEKDELKFKADFDFGPNAEINSIVSSHLPDDGEFARQDTGTVDTALKHVGQAVITYRPKNSRFTFEFGKMPSHLGLESVKTSENFNYSRTLMSTNGMPGVLVGIKAGYEVFPEALDASIYLYNGWEGNYDSNHSKTPGLQLNWTPAKAVSISYNLIAGPERPNSEVDYRILNEICALWEPEGTWSFGSDFLYGQEKNALDTLSASRGNAQWYGGMFTLKLKLNATNYISPRFELYRDQSGYTLDGPPQTLQSYTLTYGKIFTKQLEVRSEFRTDRSNKEVFPTGKDNNRNQSTLLAAALLNF